MKSSPMAASVILSLILLTLSSSSAVVFASPSTLLSASNTLSNSGYLSMALTLQLAASAGLGLDYPTATIFAPPDTAFFQSGPPSLPLLQYYISPRRLSAKTLPYLLRGTKIQTLLSNHTLTVFTAADDAVQDYARNTSDYSAIFRSHVVPALLKWKDLVALHDGATLPTFEEGFTIGVVKMGDVPVLNDVPVAYQDLYLSRFVVVHGLNRLLTSQEETVTQAEETVGDQEDGGADVNDGFVAANVAEQINPLGFDDYH
ncbi:hypothetical protein ACLB2K_068143 [Fragaria x ananassa]